MKRKKDDDPPPPKAKRNKGKAVDRGFPSLFAQTQANLFKNTSFEASDDDFQEIPLLRKDKNIRTTLKAVKEDTSAPDPSNVVTNEKTSMPAVNKDTSVQTVLPAPTPSTSCTSAPIKVSKKYQGKVDKAEALKKEKEKNKATANEQKQVRCPSCGGAGHSRSFSKLCSMNKSKTKLSTRRRKEHQECHLDEFKYISELPTLKTANLTSFLLAASTRLQNYQGIHNYYCQDKWSQKLKFKTYINKQKGTQEIVKRLFDNSKKYDKLSTVGAKNQNPNKSKHVPLPPADLPSSSQRKRIIAFGNGSFCSSVKGKRAAPTRRITEEIKRKCKQSNRGTEFVSVDEYLTSQICNKCKSKQLNNISITGSKRRVHAVLKCESYGTVWNRDVNSALNIYGIFFYKSKHDNESPPPFKRPSED